MPVYQYIGWYLASSNSLKAQQYQYLYHPQTMIPADPYHQISPSLEWHGDGASYPFLNPSNFVEYPTVYNLSRPHLLLDILKILPFDLTSQGRGYLMIWICWYHSLGVV